MQPTDTFSPDPSEVTPEAPTPDPYAAHGHDLDYGRLCDAVRAGYKAMQPYREQRMKAVEQLVGRNWSGGGSGKSVPMPLVSLWTSAVLRATVSKAPRVQYETFDAAAKPAVRAAQDWANREIVRTGMTGEFRRLVANGLYGLAVMKVGLSTPAEAAAHGYGVGAGQPYACCVDQDDFACDPNSRDLRCVAWAAHRARLPMDAVLASDLYDARVRKALTAQRFRRYNPGGDERIQELGRADSAGGTGYADDEFEDFVEVWEIYLTRRKVVVTVAADDAGNPDPTRVLRTAKWLGHPDGPYCYLENGVAVGNLMPKPPVSDLLDMHEAANRAYRKLVRQADRSKDLTVYQSAAAEDAARMNAADDGESVRVDSVQNVKPYQTGGPNQAVFQIGMHFKDMFSFVAGGMDSYAGLSQAGDTATQEKIIAGNSSQYIADLQGNAVEAISETMKRLTWLWWEHPELVMESEYTAPGVKEISLTRKVHPRGSGQDLSRDVPFDRLDLRIDPYSLQHKSPQQVASQIVQIVMSVFQPLAPLMAQQGVVLDAQALMEMLGDKTDLPQLKEILTIAEPVQPGAGGGDPGGGGMAPNTSRTYNRVSSSPKPPGQQSADAAAQFQSATAASGAGGFQSAGGAS